jgi:UDP-N-acetylglucosamine acyltransferase
MAVHPTAILKGDVELADDVEIGPYTIINGPVKIGAGTIIEERVTLSGPTDMGRKNRVHCGALVGGDPQDLSYRGQPSLLTIGDGNTIREFATVHRGWKEGATTIGNNNMLMGLVHIGHDCRIHNNCVIANGSLLAGHVTLFDRAFVSGQVVVHQFSRIGRCAMVAGLTRISRDVPPFMTAIGESMLLGLNVVGLRRAGFSPEARDALRRAFRTLFRSALTTGEAVAELERTSTVPEVLELVEFIRQSRRGICRYRRLAPGQGGDEAAGEA